MIDGIAQAPAQFAIAFPPRSIRSRHAAGCFIIEQLVHADEIVGAGGEKADAGDGIESPGLVIRVICRIWRYITEKPGYSPDSMPQPMTGYEVLMSGTQPAGTP